MTTVEQVDTILDEMRGVFARLEPDAIAKLAREITQARRIFLYGAGRTGLAMQAFAMRLAHLGLDGHFVGQLSAPPIGNGDLFVCVLSVGRLPTGDALIQTAKNAGARAAVISSKPDVVQNADLVIGLPAQTMADPLTSILPLGSPFELALTLVCDLTVVELMKKLGKSNGDLAARHANLL